MRRESKDWIEQAEVDFKAAKKNFELGFYYLSAFLIHQAIEKFLKALWIEKRREHPPRTYNLVELGRGLDAPDEIIVCLSFLSSEHIISRYPDVAGGPPFKIYTKERVKFLFEKAEKVIEWLMKELESLKKELKEKFPDVKIILFGSRAKGEFLKNSDYDLIVISKYFEKMDFFERLAVPQLLWYKVNKDDYIPADIIAYTPEEFEKISKRISIAKIAKEEGIVI